MSDSDEPVEASPTNETAFPCLEQPLRVAMHCNGFYLWSLKNGKVVARKRRSERDEFRLHWSEGSIVEIENHKFGGRLSVVQEEGDVQKLVCIKDKEGEKSATKESASPAVEDNAAQETDEKISEKLDETNNKMPGDGGDAKAQDSTATNRSQHGASVDTEDPSDDADDEENNEPVLSSDIEISTEDRQWCFVRNNRGGRNEVILKSLKTGQNLAVDTKGNISFTSDTSVDPEVTSSWDVECVTGELCFISNAALTSRIRCDLAGLPTMTKTCKGWEVFRFMEAGHGYVKIASWMHSQWLLCGAQDGTVSTCSHAESFLEDNPKGCSKWAVEKSPEGEGVIIRNKTFGGLLSVNEGILKTFNNTTDTVSARSVSEDDQVQSSSSLERSGSKDIRASWRNSIQSIQSRMNSLSSKKNGKGEEDTVSQQDTVVWTLEAAHLQTYYLINTRVEKKPRSIGPSPFVTANLRQTDKIKVERDKNGSTRLLHAEKKTYFACSSDGEIDFSENRDDENTHWIMSKHEDEAGGSLFRSKAHGLYLSYEDPEDDVEDDPSNEGSSFRPSNPFNRKAEKVTKLVGCESIEERCVWKLEPSMPRAVSSDKIKTFALGTSIAVGTTIAMPFALAGVGALLGAVGAEVGIVANAIAVGLTGAEAIASVGAIGATAYIVFRPEENSLTDDHEDEDEAEAEKAWSKRPFAAWRDW